MEAVTLEVGYLNRGRGPCKGTKAESSRRIPPDATVGESPQELTLESRGSGYVEVTHQFRGRGGVLHWLDADWHAFCQALYEGIGGEDCGRAS